MSLKSFTEELENHQFVISLLKTNVFSIEEAANLIVQTFQNGNKILLCGNGGSAADAQHIAAEFIVRYEKKRCALPAIALTTDSSILTAHANDFEFDSVFVRQIEALGNQEDCLIAISTSGNSKNIIQAVQAGLAKNMNVIVLTGETGGKLAELGHIVVKVPSTVTARIQEAHILIGHYWCGAVEEQFSC